MSSIAYEFYTLKDTSNFFNINNKAIKLSKKLSNNYALGDAYWNFATYYVRGETYNEAYHYFNQALNYFDIEKHKFESAKIIFGMARIRGFYRDYAGSENLNIKAIELFKALNNYKYLYITNNHLALLLTDIGEFEKALDYYDKSIEYINKLDDSDEKKSYLKTVSNNKALVFTKLKKYNKALRLYNQIISDKNIPINKYALYLSNRSYCKLLANDTIGLRLDFFRALHLRDSIGDKLGVLTTKIHISDYFKHEKDTTNALLYAKTANTLAKELNNGGDYLTTLNQLANLDPKNSKKYLDRYIEFNDSLISAERRTQNKFTRIEFETDEYIAETERLNQQRIWILVTSFGGILILSLLYFLRVQKVRNEKLRLEAEQQKANEEVYILTLQQQAKLEEERVNERNRISAELHDGILGKLFGTRVNLGFLAMGMQAETQEKHQTFLDELQDIEKEIRDVSHKLSDNFDSSNINFTNILEQLLKDKSNIGNFQYQFNIDKNIVWKDINEITKANLYRIIQEALQNIIKHANAKNVILDASIAQKELIISLQDDGIGFNTNKKKKGIGLKNMKARVEQIGSQLELHSTENKGTTLVIKTPLSKKDEN
ncbi:tetratricopeptide repeat-containing sensor histidine kinase [Tenacibaculum crassostreae]|uniref:tetratricopeptide repeat-containing sensor histidine kinase n=1 Tax=Tenacibaculum crassostreae TaxID=502683 RepID=UPI0038B66D6D